MKPRMMCTECFHTAEADTILEGSDLVEMLGWCCFAVPGLLYCWWRHALRIKVCAFCGSGELIREARAAAERVPSPGQAPPAAGPRVCNVSGPVRWPRALAAPRDRLRHGAVVASLAGAFLVNTALATLNLAAQETATAAACAVAAACGAWIIYEAVRVSQVRASLSGCKAWDQSGRRLRIQRVF